QEEGARPGLRRPGEPGPGPAGPARREIPAVRPTEPEPEGDPGEEVRGGPQAGCPGSQRAPAQPLRQRVTRKGALLLVGLWLGMLFASWVMATVNFRTAERVVGPSATPDMAARL